MLSFRRKTILSKIEATYAVDSVPTAAADAVLAFDVKISPMKGQAAERDLGSATPWFSAAQQFPTDLYAELSFEVDLIGHATRGTAPGWHNLMRACGFGAVVTVGTSVVYNPVSTGFVSLTHYFHLDGIMHRLRGSRGTVSLAFSEHNLPRLRFRFIGFFEVATDVALPAPVYTPYQAPLPVNVSNTTTFTVNGVALPMESFTLDAGNDLVYRELVNFQQVLITDRRPSAEARVQAQLMATFNPFLLARDQTGFALNLVHGAGSGRIVTVAAPSLRMQAPEDYGESDKIAMLSLRMTPLPVVGSDEFTLTLT